MIAFRGTEAHVLLEPSRQVEEAVTALEYLPTGGRTPLAHALELAKTYLTPSTILILLSDGKANVPLRHGDPWHDVLECTKQLRCRSLVINTENGGSLPHRFSELASVLQASSVLLADIESIDILGMVDTAGISEIALW